MLLINILCDNRKKLRVGYTRKWFMKHTKYCHNIVRKIVGNIVHYIVYTHKIIMKMYICVLIIRKFRYTVIERQ